MEPVEIRQRLFAVVGMGGELPHQVKMAKLRTAAYVGDRLGLSRPELAMALDRSQSWVLIAIAATEARMKHFAFRTHVDRLIEAIKSG
jgi:hypothetical protein